MLKIIILCYVFIASSYTERNGYYTKENQRDEMPNYPLSGISVA